mmetsp:Transcript_12080/g.31017  ORF Transcript_12080/g.31017 Transcript_12080/m.31017 type:complete len:222 (+) Transcript_12080:351-1016(+)
MAVEQVLLQDLGVKLLLLHLIAHKALLAVGHVEAAVQASLEGAKDLGARGGALQAGIQHAEEGTGALLVGLHAVHLAVGLLLALICLVQAKLGEHAARQQQASSVRSSVVLQAALAGQSIVGQLMSVGGRHNHVAGDGGIRQLAGNVAVGEAHDDAVLGRRVLVLVLQAQPQARAVVRLALAPAAELDLVAAEIGAALHDLGVTHGGSRRPSWAGTRGAGG